MTRMPIAVVVVAASVALSGCGIDDPYAEEDRQARQSATPEPPKATPETSAAHEEDGHPAPRPKPPAAPAGGGAPSASEAARLYATTFANWTWRDVADRSEKVLARLAAGDLREIVLINAEELREDVSLRRDRASSHGDVVALDEQGGDAARRTVWVVSRETASAAGYASESDTRLVVYRLTVERLRADSWYVTEFEPQG